MIPVIVDKKLATPDRRRFLARIAWAIQGLIGGSVAFVLGGSIVPPRVRTADNWLRAAALADLKPNAPTPALIRTTRDDGYRQVIDRRVVFLVKTGDTEVTALSSTCTHLGCRVSWDPETQVLQCPCHGGTYDRTGAVLAGPPPAPLAKYPTRVDGDQVLVQV